MPSASGVSAGTSVVSETGVGVGSSDVCGTSVGVTVGVTEGSGVDTDGSAGVPVPEAPLSDWVIRSPAGSGVGVGSGAAVSPAIASSSGRAHRHTHRPRQAPRICRFLTERMLNLLLETQKSGASKAPSMT